MTGGPIVFAQRGFEGVLSPARAGAEAGAFRARRFDNGELHIKLATPVVRRDCIVVGSVSPPEANAVELLLLADTLVREGAGRVQAVLPYLAYARQDRPAPRESLAIAWLGGALRAAGVHDVVTVDPHSDDALRLLGCPVHALPSTAVLAAGLREDGIPPDAVVVAPDGGAIGRAEALAATLGCGSAWFEKRRTPEGVEHGALNGEVGRAAIVVDDILDTGATLVSCCRELAGRGVERIQIATTHGLFTGEHWRELLAYTALVHVTDTVPFVAERAPGAARVHRVAALLEEAVRATGEFAAPGADSVRATD